MRVQPVLIHNAKKLSKKTCDVALGKPNISFVAYSNSRMALLI